MELFLVRTPFGFSFATDDDKTAARGLAKGVVVRAQIRQPRRYWQHKLFFKMINLVFDNLPNTDALIAVFGIGKQAERDARDDFRRTLLIMAGFSHAVIHPGTGEVVGVRSESMSFASMKQSRFEEVFAKVFSLICLEFMISEAGLKEQLRVELDGIADAMYLLE